ncbi:MAG: hypothetical protein GY811_28170, partial [Myxococcales bacterium]|nr:hypothetical protein [Myxococcales bacterium]
GDTIPADVTGNAITDLADFDAQVMVGQSLRLEGFLFHYTSGERAYELCETMCESFPPQCCGNSVVLTGVDAKQAATRLDAQSDDGAIGWSSDTVVCSGDANDSGFAVTSIETTEAADEPAEMTTHTRCDSDADCEDGKHCHLVAACETCDGGTMQCIE